MDQRIATLLGDGHVVLVQNDPVGPIPWREAADRLRQSLRAAAASRAIEPAAERFHRSETEHVSALMRQALAVLEQAQFIKGIDAYMAVATDPETPIVFQKWFRVE